MIRHLISGALALALACGLGSVAMAQDGPIAKAALTAFAKLNPSLPLNRLQTALMHGDLFPSVMASPPTVSQRANGAVPSSRGSFIPLADARIWCNNNDRLSVAQTGAQNDGVTRNYYKAQWSGSVGSTAYYLQCSFITDSPSFDIVTTVGNTPFMLFEDDQIANSTGSYFTSAAGSSNFGWTIVNPARQMHRYRFITSNPVAGIWPGPTDTFIADDRSKRLNLGFMGDSFLQASPSGWGGTFATMVAAHLDANSVQDACGGSGYAELGSPGPPACTNFYGRDVLTTPPTPGLDAYITAGGINDYNGYTQAQFTTAVQQHFAYVRVTYPRAVSLAIGPWAPAANGNPSANTLYIRDTIKTQLAAAGGPWVFLDNLTGQWTTSCGGTGPLEGPAQTGVGNSSSPTGSGNGDNYVSSDGTHPTTGLNSGVDYLGYWLSANMRKAILGMSPTC